MKNKFKPFVAASLLLIAACSKEDSNQAPPEDLVIQEQEQTPLAIETVAENVIISGATKKEGTPPTPNEAISLDVSKSSKNAFLNEGFEISYQSNATVSGAYLQFKANDGTMAEGYYDINLAANKSGKKKVAIKDIFEKGNSGALKVEDEETIDVDFNANIEPGTFCYVVCVYDDEGNISIPQEVCVTVEAWGGLSDLVGEWVFVKVENTQDGVKTAINSGEDFCVAYDFPCVSGTFEYSACTSIDYGNYHFKEDGTFYADSGGIISEPDGAASYEQCTTVSSDGQAYGTAVEGYWSYISEGNKLVLYGYTYLEIDGNEEFPVEFDSGEAEVFFDGEIDLNGNSLIIEETQQINILDQISELNTKTYLERK